MHAKKRIKKYFKKLLPKLCFLLSQKFSFDTMLKLSPRSIIHSHKHVSKMTRCFVLFQLLSIYHLSVTFSKPLSSLCDKGVSAVSI